jgi:hypothetical protein
VKFEIRYLESTATHRHVDEGPRQGRAKMAVIQPRPTETSQPLLADTGTGFLMVKTYRMDRNHRVPSADWLHDFAPKFGLGRFCVFELPQPEIIGTGSVQDTAKVALAAARKAEDELRAGRWTDACEELRRVWELIRNDVDIQTLLQKEGYTADAASTLNDAIKKLFDFSSKFMHAKDKAGAVIPPAVKAEKEDAYLVFATAMSIINLIAQKAR